MLYSWSAFIALWFITALVLTLIEDKAEDEDMKQFRKTWKSIYYNEEKESYKETIDIMLDIMGPKCHIPTVDDANWNVSREFFFFFF